MPILLKSKNYRVFASIFKIGKGDRRAITWKEFVRTMKALGFDYCKNSGSKRAFRPGGSEFQHTFGWHAPHDGVLSAHLQNLMAIKLVRTFGWTAASFKLKQ
ncbi:uncharacterized protein TRAVEDRAFT_45205 [Trametes versicolor FP-101664 SS1]|uniref:uncharacterized protein n=1 Tax=Trametes versicolor (strain FP-101664) TaxID=717944 RepID=UPI000462345F|nr:uncharacterized protein TRAVEDRAFT_45205 [Trametes versicolor FP-101664 SS1]EIW62385.1 hypothetical protein TRAVEDRAFT_45205 [Trametes versicolor FP-101664 SS1]